jgi:hypothetical protein
MTKEEALRQLRREDPEAFRKAMEEIRQRLEAETGDEITVEILYDN